MKNLTKYIYILIVVIIIIIYVSMGIYQVDASEVGLVKRFGRYVRTTGPGIHFHLPPPIVSVTKVEVRTL